MRRMKWKGAFVMATGALVLTGGCSTTPAKTEGPTEVRVSELAPEVLDELAERVADKLRPAVVANNGGLRGPFAGRGGPVVRPVVRPPKRVPSVDPVPTVDPVPSEPLDRATVKAIGESVDLSLAWLAKQQDEDGSWHPERLRGEANYTPGVTGLITLAFLEAGHTHMSGKYKDQVKAALRYLKGIQDPQGCFGLRVSQHYMYNHAAASLAMIEAYRRTESKLFQEPAQLAVNFIHHAQNPYLGWRYGVRDGDNDTSVTGWMTHVLDRARGSLEVDASAFRGARAWVEKMTDPEFGRVGYQQRGGMPARTSEMMDKYPSDRSESLTAIGVLIRMETGSDPKNDELVVKGATLLGQKLPVWGPKSGNIDYYYWHWGTRAMARVGGDGWLRWQRALSRALLEGQDKKSEHTGSWPIQGPWGNVGGRFYTTAMSCLALQEVRNRAKSD